MLALASLVRYSATILEVVGRYARIMFGDLLARTHLRMHSQGMLMHARQVASTLRISLSGMAPTWHLTRDNYAFSRVRMGRISLTCRRARIDPVLGTLLFGLVLLVGAPVGIRSPEATLSRATIGAGVVLIACGQGFLGFGFISGWRLLFAPKVDLPSHYVAGTAIADYAEPVKALSAAPNWLSLTAVGTVQTVVSVLLHLGRHANSLVETTNRLDSQLRGNSQERQLWPR